MDLASRLVLILMWVGFVLGLIGLVAANGEQLSFEPNTPMDLKAYCYDANNSECGSGTSCQISVFYPNNSIYINNKSMSKTNTYFNYTANATSTLGVYKAVIDCDSAVGSHGYQDFKFYVGNPSTFSQGSANRNSIYVLFGICVIFFIGFLFTKNTTIKWNFLIVALLFLLITLNLMSVMIRNEAGDAEVRNFFDAFVGIIWIAYWFLGAFFLTLWIFTFLNTHFYKKHNQHISKFGNAGQMP